MACYQKTGPAAVRTAFKNAIGVLPNHDEWHTARSRGAKDVIREMKEAKAAGMKIPGGPKAFADPDEAVKAVFAMYESLGYSHEQAWEAPGAHDLLVSLADGKTQLRRAQVAGLKHLRDLTARKIQALPTNRIIVTGDMDRQAVQRALYGGWEIERFDQGEDGNGRAHNRVILRAPVDQPDGFGLRNQADRLRSFGTVGVREIGPTDTVIPTTTADRIESYTGLTSEQIAGKVSAGFAEVLAHDAQIAYRDVQNAHYSTDQYGNRDEDEVHDARESVRDVLKCLGVKNRDLDAETDRVVAEAIDRFDPTPY